MEAKSWQLAQVELHAENQGFSNLETRIRVRDFLHDTSFSGYLCYVDGSWKGSEKNSRLGWYCISSSGEMPTMGAANIRKNLSPLHAEVEALMWEMNCMIGADNQEVVFLTDYSDLVKMVSSSTEWPAFSVYLEELQSDKIAQWLKENLHFGTRKYYWDQGIIELVKEGFLVIAKKGMKGIVSQAKNTDRGGLGVHKQLAGQKSFVQVHQEMEERLKRPVSYGEVFMQTHTRADGSFVNQKSQHVGEAYVKVYVCLGKQGATEGAYHLYVLDLGKLERTNRKTQRLAMVDRVIRADAEGVLRDEDGQAYNEAARDAAGLAVDRQNRGVDRYPREQNEDVIGVERHNRGVDRHQHQIPTAILQLRNNVVLLGISTASWMKQLKEGSLKTWRSIKIAFLNNFYDDAKSEELRNKLSTFTQGPAEDFKAAWVRFKEYQRDCPHHGFSEVQLLGTFLRGVDWRYQMALDVASNGNFNIRYPADATALIENLACSNSTKNADFERKKIARAISCNQMAELNAKLDSVHNLLTGKNHVHFPAEEETIELEPESEEGVFYIDGQGYKKFGQPHGNFSGNRFTGNQETRMESMLEQIQESQTKLVVEFNGKFDAVYTDLNGKIDNLSSHLKKLDVQVAQTAQSIKRQEVFFPGNPDANPRKSCNAILIREGDDVWEELDTEDELELAVAEMTASCKVQIPMHPESIYSPTVPYPRRRRSKKEVHAAKCAAIMEKILHSLPKDASETSSAPLNRYIKRLGDNGISSDEAKLLTRDISAIMLPKVKKEKAQRVDIAEYIRTITLGQTTVKLPDPGSFVLDYTISTSRFSRSLCDRGSSINLMPKFVAERLGMTHYRLTGITLLFADRSKRFPKEILEDVHVKVGNSIIPSEFVVLDYEKEPKDPLMLGRAFLATAGARFDVKRGRISLKVCDLDMEFGMDGSELTKSISSIASSTDTPPQNPTTEPHTALPSAQLANESCRATVSIDTTTPVDRHPRVSQTENSAHSLQPTPLEDLCNLNHITHTDGKGNPFGLGSLMETLNKRRRKESYASSSTSTVAQLQEQLHLKIFELEEQNAKRNEENHQSQSRIASLEKLVLFMKEKDPELAAYLSTDSTEPEPETHPTTTTPSTLPTTTTTAPAIIVAGTTPLVSTSATISNTSSNH
ncbi:putative transposase Ptta/En/Spm plant [Arabidopsis thaliana x Arabidopsis arenosa]|uniref:Putative transposase Ptta/En/Spm plant n=1 Tax=Arabidopsis thaliana x Arabidopsis arenosa TaxID=1240361 RepID=A0A8T2CZF6_9BRAS|nr:putative transposase Ptta/En/Spm plant [Arabidopsis thaliana x Arabidopsis arenosa]